MDISELTHETDDESMKMTWKELKHEINMAMLDFKRTYSLECNILILGKKEYEVLQGDEAAKSFDVGSDEGFVDGEVAQIWSMRICRVNMDSIVKVGHLM